MPRLVKGGKWAYGWVVVGPEREIRIPPQAWQEYRFHVGAEAIFVPGSRTSGGFAITTPSLLDNTRHKNGGALLRELGRGWFGEAVATVPPQVAVEPGDRLLAVRGSGRALAFVARGPIHDEAQKHPELEVFAWDTPHP